MKKLKLLSSLVSVAIVSTTTPIIATSCSDVDTKVIEKIPSKCLDVEKADNKPTICSYILDNASNNLPYIVTADAEYDKDKVSVNINYFCNMVTYTLSIVTDAEVVSGDKTSVTFKFKDTDNNDYVRTVEFTFTDHDYFLSLAETQGPEITYQYCTGLINFKIYDFNLNTVKTSAVEGDFKCTFNENVFKSAKVVKDEDNNYFVKYEVKSNAPVGKYIIQIQYNTPIEAAMAKLDCIVFIQEAKFDISCKLNGTSIDAESEQVVKNEDFFTLETKSPEWERTKETTTWKVIKTPEGLFSEFDENELTVVDATKASSEGSEVVIQLLSNEGATLASFKFKVKQSA
ncbi:MAG: hypothetical protein HUJ52_00025 [Malacoplasma sp.]|nr:hypothetical protein [Malacoplasma sp.]